MKEDEFKKGIEDLKKIRLENEEKANLLRTIFASPVSPYYKTKINFWTTLPKPAFIMALTLILVMTGGVAAYNAEGSLPGDILYPLKINVSEPIRDFINLEPTKQAEWEGAKAMRRLDEAAFLAVEGKLDEEKRDSLETSFNRHADAFNDSVSKATSTPETDFIKIKFEADISAHAKVLENLSNTENMIRAKSGQEKARAQIHETDLQESKYGKDEYKNEGKEELKKLKDAVESKLKEIKTYRSQKDDREED
jgi:hypothetical protein